MDATDVAQRRATALRMSRDDYSLREIGEHLGVSKDTVKRDIAAAERDEQQPDATPVALPGHRLTLDVDEALAEDLDVLLRTGRSTRQVVGEAVRHLADVHRAAYDYGDYPDGAPVRAVTAYAPCDTDATPVARRDGTE